jgi:hypothetical protein
VEELGDLDVLVGHVGKGYTASKTTDRNRKHDTKIVFCKWASKQKQANIKASLQKQASSKWKTLNYAVLGAPRPRTGWWWNHAAIMMIMDNERQDDRGLKTVLDASA